MNLFNKRVIQKHLETYTLPSNIDLNKILLHLQNLQHFLKTDAERTSEKSIQGLFLQRIFEDILGYSSQLAGQEEYNLKVEPKTETDSTHPDGSLGFLGKEEQTKVVIELKDASTSLDNKQYSRALQVTPVEQAFNYSHRYSGCKWIIVSNFREIRLYSAEKGINYFETFDVATLGEEQNLRRFYLLLNKSNLISKNQVPFTENLLREAYFIEQDITKKFYQEYRSIRFTLFQHLVENNPNVNRHILLEKTQKTLDRIIFVSFCEDLNLLPTNILRKIVDHSKNSLSSSDEKIWVEVKNLFKSIDMGYAEMDINKFNGGLFAKDDILDNLIIKDEVINNVLKLADYNFESDLNVNILGHIFEQSISDLEEIKLGISEGIEIENIGRRKSEGIYYTPEHITRYIVSETIGKWLEDKKIELGFKNLPKLADEDIKTIKFSSNKRKSNKNIKSHIDFWEKYKEELQNIKVLDPACGSGAFLNQVFDFLYQEGQSVNKSLAELRGGQVELFSLDKYILQNNIFGVDLNQESVDITKLSLWLKTASRQNELTTLDNNIKCGNSLIDDKAVDEIKAFSWQENFKEIFSDGGFDIIIGNPPYEVLSEKESGIKDLEKILIYIKNDVVLSKAIRGKNNLYKLFICKGVSLLKANGYISYIVPMALLGDSQSYTVRKVLLEETSIQKIDTFPQKDDVNNRIFEDAKLSTCIFLTKKSSAGDSFIVKTNSGKWIDYESQNYLEISSSDIHKFDQDNLTIPNCNNNDWNIIKKIIGNHYFKRFGEVIKQYQGEINETVQNQENVLTQDKSYASILRGANITMYAVREASQGEPLYLDDSKYLKDRGKDSKAFHHLKDRVGFQRSSPQNNFRRIIAAPISKGYYCFDTVSYITEDSSKIDLNIVLILLNSNLYDWYFRCFSTNSKVNEYQLNMLPFFLTNDNNLQEITDLINAERYPELINVLEDKVTLENKIPSWTIDLLKKLSLKIQQIEQKRELKSRKERSKLDDSSSPYQRYVNTILYKAFKLNDEEINYVERRRKEML